MNLSDIILISILALLAFKGISRGFMHSLISPLTCTIAYVAALIVFNHTHKFLIPVLVVVIGPMLLSWLIRIMLEVLNKNAAPGHLSVISRVSGAAIEMAWGGSIVLALMVVGAILPFQNSILGDISKNIRASQTYRLLQKPLERFGVIPIEDVRQCADKVCSMPEEKAKDLAADKDVQELLKDPQFQKLLSDPSIQQAAKKKDFGAILSNPTIIELGNNPALVSKILRLYPKIKASTSDQKESSY